MSEDNAIRRLMPSSLEAERSVLGAVLIDSAVVVTLADILTKEDFYNPQYGAMFQAMVELYNSGSPIDQVTLKNKLASMDAPAELASDEFIAEIVNGVPTSANAEHYAHIVADKATLRRLIHSCDDISADCYKGTSPLEAIIDEAQRKVFDIAQGRGATDYIPIRKLAMDAFERIEKASRNKSPITGIESGFMDLDYRTAGFQNSDLVLIAARPSMGKTAFALNIAQNVAFRKGECVAIFSLEMSRDQLMNRLYALESKVDSQHIRTGRLEDSEWADLVDASGIIGLSKLIIDDTPAMTVQALRRKCRKYKIESGLSMVIIDYLQLMSAGSESRRESRQLEISEISRSLKTLARELDVPILALSQLSRAPEQRENHRPMLSDLRDSGAIEQDADVVMFLYRDDYYDHDSEDKDVAEVIVAKQRNGPTGTVRLKWLPDYMKFGNLDTDTQKGA